MVAADEIKAVDHWTDNSELMLDCLQLGYLTVGGKTLDPTYGDGVWWKHWRPDNLVTHDLKVDGVDFRHLPEDDATFDHIAFDPPYVSKGGRETTTMPEFEERYGLKHAPRTPATMQTMIDDGLEELMRVLKPGGTLLVKCADYVSSGKVWWGTDHTNATAVRLGLFKQDRFDYYSEPRPQPLRKGPDGKPVRQQHARRNSSTLFVYINKQRRKKLA